MHFVYGMEICTGFYWICCTEIPGAGIGFERNVSCHELCLATSAACRNTHIP
jgi:hypothetical protein